jgi:polar amino acid transport system substrate-binding protein
MRQLYIKLISLIFLLLLTCGASAQQKSIPIIWLYTTYDFPPFTVERDKGINYVLADYLNRAAQGKYQFKVKQIPKKRIRQILNDPHWQGVVLWNRPEWMEDSKEELYHWTDTVIADGERVLSRANASLEWSSPSSINGRRFGAIQGFSYPELELGFAQGLIVREDAPSFWSNVKKLESGRVDVIYLPNSFSRYLQVQYPDIYRKIYVSKRWPFGPAYAKRLMSNVNDTEFAQWLDAQVKNLSKDPIWLSELDKYDLRPR